MWTEHGKWIEIEEACNIDDKKPLLKFELPAASAPRHFILVLIRICIAKALIHTDYSAFLFSLPFIEEGGQGHYRYRKDILNRIDE